MALVEPRETDEVFDIDGFTLTLAARARVFYGDIIEINFDAGDRQPVFSLEQTPNAGITEVFVNDRKLTEGFSIQGNTLTFQGEAIPEYDDTIKVNYGIGRSINEAELQNIPNADTLGVRINGQVMAEEPPMAGLLKEIR